MIQPQTDTKDIQYTTRNYSYDNKDLITLFTRNYGYRYKNKKTHIIVKLI